MNTLSTIKNLRNQEEDFEWYPTTNEILESFEKDLETFMEDSRKRTYNCSFVDIGAGDGKVLKRVKEKFKTNLFVEKSQFHNSNMDKDFCLMGTDFHKTTFIDKEVDIVFCNPPYSEFKEWARKILKEFYQGTLIYLVIPERWENDIDIQNIIRDRKIDFEIVGNFDFKNSEDRKARAKVHLIRFYIRKLSDKGDPFFNFFSETFDYPEKEEEGKEEDKKESELVGGENLIERLCTIYDCRLMSLQENYRKICELDFSLLREFEISKESLSNSLKSKIRGLKKKCWQEFFEGMDGINTRLTSSSRNKMLSLLNDRTGVDFNIENCYNVILWVVKNANKYFEDQFLEIYDKLTEFANVENYKSNQRVFTKDKFRYSNSYYEDSELRPTHYKLRIGNRIVLERCGGLERHQFSVRTGISETSAKFIGDLMTIAGNLGFKVLSDRPQPYEWDGNESKDFFVEVDGKEELLFRVRAFYNRNMHFQFLPEFIHALNIQHGKLRGWLNSKEDVENEILAEDDDKKVLDYFDRSIRIEPSQFLLKS